MYLIGQILKYPQIGSSSRTRASAKPALNPGPSAERTERPSVGQDFLEGMVLGMVHMVITPDIDQLMMRHHPKMWAQQHFVCRMDLMKAILK
ncbi:casein kinase 1-like protein 11 [Rosa rugosa]|uniref:casein kinase 1-like protein 11 n=1 Tax=Rosa rugosa TaxID=74645 RepID=UPI002B417258|nr:casein kinase 1-like protein 11 [Rosa rugosa]